MFFVVVLRLFGQGSDEEPAVRDEPEGEPASQGT
jgi:hypothetical protein